MYYCIGNENVEDPKAAGDERKVKILALTSIPPTSAEQVENLGNNVVFGVGSTMEYPDGGIELVYQSDRQWHRRLTSASSGGGTSGGIGTDDYNALLNKPQIEARILQGNKSAEELNLASLTYVDTKLGNVEVLLQTI